MDIKALLTSAKSVINNNSPAILTGSAAAGVLSTAILTGIAAVKADRAYSAYVDSRRLEEAPPTKTEYLQQVWMYYIPPFISATATIACVFGMNSIHNRRNAALFSAYTLSEKAMTEYRDRVIQEIGENTNSKIQDSVLSDKVTSAGNPSEVVVLGSGETLCYDSLTGRYFKSDMETIRRAQNDINQRVINDSYCSQNEFYNLIGLPSVDLGEELGWNTENMMDIHFVSVLSEDGRPCLGIDYHLSPVKKYYKIW